MKKLVLTISFLCYLTVTCGVVVNLHYCMDRLASVHFFGDESDQCGQCGMLLHENNTCCHDEVKVFKLEQDHNKVSITDYTPVFTTELALLIHLHYYPNRIPICRLMSSVSDTLIIF